MSFTTDFKNALTAKTDVEILQDHLFGIAVKIMNFVRDSPDHSLLEAIATDIVSASIWQLNIYS